MEAAKVSVIIPAYNADRWIRTALDSALNQTFRPYEIIVIDDGSTDRTEEIIGGYKTDARVFRQERAGVSAARNLGMKHAAGDWLAFLDADDFWLPQKLERVIAFAAKAADAALISHDTFVIDEHEKLVGAYLLKANTGGGTARELVQGNWIVTSTVMLRTEAARKTGGFRTDIHKGEDWHFWLRVANKYPIDHLKEPLAFYRRHAAGAIRSDLDVCLADTLKALEDAGALMGITESEKMRARASVYRQSAVRRHAAFDAISARRELIEAQKLDGWTQADAALWFASLLPVSIRRTLLHIKRFNDARAARRLMKSYGISPLKPASSTDNGYEA